MSEDERVRTIAEQIADLDDGEKVDFFQRYLREEDSIPLEVLAYVYENLGDLSVRSGRPRGTWYAKAGSTWEILSAVGSLSEKDAVRRALQGYTRAFALFKRNRDFSRMAEMREKMTELRIRSRSYGGPVRTLTFVLAITLFLFSFAFLSPPTGLAISHLSVEDSTFVGGITVLIGIVLFVFALLRWR